MNKMFIQRSICSSKRTYRSTSHTISVSFLLSFYDIKVVLVAKWAEAFLPEPFRPSRKHVYFLFPSLFYGAEPVHGGTFQASCAVNFHVGRRTS